ncbi:UDP-N-acetyl-D-mannosamine dehydrogenase [Methylobacterium oxalidis]|uniref:UDP-N-acetyl-D-mannosamine dehydrogenase n=1 Tax=Methylobacterium oxalidis TaxID=944322 RepID=A0A512J7C6_9HYPH|nr:UDP-N-acetyl-D-mannosamine dehydrogenase [Methylobacterium oxalidis]GEP05802.1 UDP-N-acetyl-D-mannosamine dehydrogenase [Methylobacterium oxalidis]GJE35319.1 UDP-N-acetyl-D-mannosamine dehydrogenase [Methylobacterium oxalidis]GLS62616.1 UDP-N-acetyl-D-mannosamine dehydrogenase [Methylobacterium oxalidis]
MTRTRQTISVIGLGYVGLPTAATFASRGLHVIGVDIREDAVERIRTGQAHFIEPDLDIVLRAVVTAGNLRATTHPEPADAFLIAVPTPIRDDKTADLTAVRSALASVAPVLKRGDLIIIESTCPVGTTQGAAEQLRGLRPDLTFPDTDPETSDILLAYSPERILPGHTLRELIENPRTYGGLDHRSAVAAKELYAVFATGPQRLTTAPTAELSKLVENAYRDVNVAFANELSLVCDALGLDVWSVIRLANLHPRVNILAPGAGVGGHCIPVDPWFIHEALPQQTPLIRASREVNDGKPRFLADKIAGIASRFREPKIALLGLTYKPNVDDLRESPALHIACDLADRRIGQLMIVEPHVPELPEGLSDRTNVELMSLNDAVAAADVVAVLVAHDRFRNLNRGAVSAKIVVDAVGLLAQPLEAA